MVQPLLLSNYTTSLMSGWDLNLIQIFVHCARSVIVSHILYMVPTTVDYRFLKQLIRR